MPGINKYGWLLIVLFIGQSGRIYCQFYETIRSGRPGQSVGASTVGKGIFQIQSGFDHFGYENQSQGETNSGFLNSTAMRYGMTESFEVGMAFEYRTETTTTPYTSTSKNSLSNMLVGLRHQISSGKGLIPSIGFQFRLRLPVTENSYKINYVAPSFSFVTSQQLSKSITLITNLGSSWNGMDAIPSGTYTVNLSCALSDSFGFFVENYGTLAQWNLTTRLDGGIAWLATKNLQLDLFGGFGNNDGLHDYFISTGFSWRTHRVKKL